MLRPLADQGMSGSTATPSVHCTACYLAVPSEDSRATSTVTSGAQGRPIPALKELRGRPIHARHLVGWPRPVRRGEHSGVSHTAPGAVWLIILIDQSITSRHESYHFVHVRHTRSAIVFIFREFAFRPGVVPRSYTSCSDHIAEQLVLRQILL